MERRTFLGLIGLGAIGLVTGCQPLNEPINKGSHKKRSYPCGKPNLKDPNTWEYTVVTTNRYPIKINGKWTKTHKVFIICGQKNAQAHKKSYRKDLVTRTAP